VAAPAAEVVTTTGAANQVAIKKAGPGAGKRVAAAGKMKMPAASAETTVKRALPVKAAAPVTKAGVRKRGKKRGPVQA
jgi:hypothetical protein